MKITLREKRALKKAKSNSWKNMRIIEESEDERLLNIDIEDDVNASKNDRAMSEIKSIFSKKLNSINDSNYKKYSKCKLKVKLRLKPTLRIINRCNLINLCPWCSNTNLDKSRTQITNLLRRRQFDSFNIYHIEVSLLPTNEPLAFKESFDYLSKTHKTIQRSIKFPNSKYRRLCSIRGSVWKHFVQINDDLKYLHVFRGVLILDKSLKKLTLNALKLKLIQLSSNNKDQHSFDPRTINIQQFISNSDYDNHPYCHRHLWTFDSDLISLFKIAPQQNSNYKLRSDEVIDKFFEFGQVLTSNKNIARTRRFGIFRLKNTSIQQPVC